MMPAVLATGILLAATLGAAPAQPPTTAIGDSTGGNPRELFAVGNAAYRRAYAARDVEGRRQSLEEAAAAYLAVLDVRQNGYAWYNLGNALYRLGKSGGAIYCYRRARLLLGAHPDVLANLEYVRSIVKEAPAVPAPHPLASVLFFWYFPASLRALECAFVATCGGFFATVSLMLWRGRGRLLYVAAALGLLTVLAAGGVAARYRAWYRPSVIVTARPANVLSETQPLATPLFVLGEGAEVQGGRRRNGLPAATGAAQAGWTEVYLPDGRHGWLSDEDLVGEAALRTGFSGTRLEKPPSR